MLHPNTSGLNGNMVETTTACINCYYILNNIDLLACIISFFVNGFDYEIKIKAVLFDWSEPWNLVYD